MQLEETKFNWAFIELGCVLGRPHNIMFLNTQFATTQTELFSYAWTYKLVADILHARDGRGLENLANWWWPINELKNIQKKNKYILKILKNPKNTYLVLKKIIKVYMLLNIVYNISEQNFLYHECVWTGWGRLLLHIEPRIIWLGHVFVGRYSFYTPSKVVL